MRPADGTELWSTPSSSNGAAPVVFGDLVIAGAPVVARDAATGEERWRLPDDITAVGQPVVVGDVVVVAVGGGAIGVDGATGAVRWEGVLPNTTRALFSPMAVAGDAVAIPTVGFFDGFGFVNGPLVVIDAGTGEVRWQLPVTERLLGKVGAVGDRVAVVSLDGTVTTFDAEDGTPVAAWSDIPITGDAIIDPEVRPVVVGESVIITLGNAVAGIDAAALEGTG